MSIADIHRHANRRSGTYEQRKARWGALHKAADLLVRALPFATKIVAMDNPTQNHTGMTNGRNHIVLLKSFMSGRLVRHAGDALCGVDTANLWNDTDRGATCKKCLELAERLVAKEAQS